ncbi:MAG: AI-2E family transporter [Clostridiales bacterium]
MQKKLWLIALILGMGIFLLVLVYYFSNLVLLTFGSIILAYLLFPMVEHFQKKTMPLNAAIALTYLIIGAVLLFICFVVFPAFYEESSNFLANTTVFYGYFVDMWQWITGKIDGVLSFSSILEWKVDVLPLLEEKISTYTASMVDRLMEVPEKISYLILSPVIAYYFLRDHDKIGGALLTVFPPKHRSEVLILAKETNDVLWGFIRGNLLVSLIVGTLTGLGLWLLGVDYPLVLGVLAGLFDIIPYFGPILSGIPILIIALLQPDVNLVLVLILLILVQQLENIVVSPRIIGDRVGLHPVVIILLVFLGGSLGGILGMVLVIPLAAVGKVLLMFCYQRFVGFRFH